ncbi:unnamed protein product [Allacma fusca]|uniref:Uncharacterized protein n=1 Tax=Allacma fusca TaxID=39272 RepID=A0A8J2JK48_9HEXA|nr:unnamed protein product [Allacma fusca]
MLVIRSISIFFPVLVDLILSTKESKLSFGKIILMSQMMTAIPTMDPTRPQKTWLKYADSWNSPLLDRPRKVEGDGVSRGYIFEMHPPQHTNMDLIKTYHSQAVDNLAQVDVGEASPAVLKCWKYSLDFVPLKLWDAY